MRFARVPLDDAAGAILAHSLGVPDGRIKKGTRLGPDEIERLRAAGHAQVVAARLDDGDLPEDEAAARIGAALAPDPAALGLTRSAPFTGRLNLYAATGGVVSVDAEAVRAINAVDEAVTLATVADRARVTARQMIATVKIIPYAAPEAAVRRIEALIAGRPDPLIRLHGLVRDSATLILTRVAGMKPALVEKGAEAVRARLRALGIELAREVVVAHDEDALAAALADAPGAMVLILTGSATSDRGDVGPAALVASGGRLTRFGMPVDPGNLLFLGELAGRPVIGLPGCARSPKLNGADWVLERVACGLDPDWSEIAAMGVGGLLKEIPSRPQPRTGEAPREASGEADDEGTGRWPRISAVLLAAGASRRMEGADKLTEMAGGRPLLARAAAALAASAVEEVVAVLRPGDSARAAALQGLGVRVIENPRAADGMGTSIAAGVAALAPGIDAAMIALGDMPDLDPADIDRLIAAFDPAEGRAIVRARGAEGAPGHPVIFGRRFFEPLRALEGDAGARAVIAEHPEFVVDVTLSGRSALTDLDTPQDWEAWRARQAGA
ncbi:molybdopterin-binding/glycosyltransferase family 2 protein [Thermohalobaculum xanthum]|uniref:molybdopterin-binding/glycosyltransferase family 2 protein n=1 Tax=Thermohalobaculum xanthum TaxID=2753746 RepID=UPI002D7F4C75|nr:molybdopterin-binding/glycosyltransferase family 2 protein [Thermohalobaculum xanthum]